MPRYFIRGRGDVVLSETDFKGQGGQASVYARGSTAYKIYTNANAAIPEARIRELSALTLPNILRPRDALFDEGGALAGYSMRYVDNAYALCQLFPPSFRARSQYSADAALRLVKILQDGVTHVHSKGILIVDLNEMNFLVSRDFAELYFIDVDSYQTPSFAATAIMDTVRDRHSQFFNQGTDWFSFAVVSFQMFTGIHPYRGVYAPLTGRFDKTAMLDERMKANISVLHRGVSLPVACLSFDIIPPIYRAWYVRVLEEGERQAPPGQPVDSISLRSVVAPEACGGGAFEFSKRLRLEGEILDHFAGITLTAKGAYYAGAFRQIPAMGAAARVALAPRTGRPIVAVHDGPVVRFADVGSGGQLGEPIPADDVMATEGRIYMKLGLDLLEVELFEIGSKVLPQARPVGQVLNAATQLFEGVAMQSLAGAWYASFLPRAGTCYQTRIRELDGYRIVDGRCTGTVLVLVAIKDGVYDRFVLRFDADFSKYDLRIIKNVDLESVNFTVLDNGLCLHLAGGQLEMFRNRPWDSAFRVLSAEALAGFRLFHQGVEVLAAKDGAVYKISLRQ